jgi:hypothetical protein
MPRPIGDPLDCLPRPAIVRALLVESEQRTLHLRALLAAAEAADQIVPRPIYPNPTTPPTHSEAPPHAH